MATKTITVYGIVQGVGFRPYVYKIAKENNLNGIVTNNNEGVYIEIEGQSKNIENFIEKLKKEPPPLSKIIEINIKKEDKKNFKDFKIIESVNNKENITLISPDMSICKDCSEDIRDKNNRRYNYAFTNCTNCGPRFSIIKKIPYDRKNTTMNKFTLCDKCKEEYDNPLNRRFHAQPNACPICGPRLELLNNSGEKLFLEKENIKDTYKKRNNENIIEEQRYIIKKVRELIKQGNILAIKGIGGFHLVCNGNNEEAIQKLRNKKNRRSKPLAVMMKDLETVKNYCYVSEKEEELLIGNRKPIVILKKKEDTLPINISFENKTIGVMLPYTPLHSLLFEENINVLIMTSANLSGEPMIYENNEALEKLNNIVDYFLLNNRDIFTPVDDSIAKVILGEETLIRPGRGYAPLSIELKNIGNRISLGTYFKNTISVSKEDYIFISEYIGDMENLSTEKSFIKSINHIKDIYEIKEEETIAIDSHPEFDFTKLLKSKPKVKIKAQHHHSHIVSAMVENNIEKKVIGIAFDGTGYGEDNNIWGGEFLICDFKDFERMGHFNYFNLPGGESAIKDVWKIGLSLVKLALNEESEKYLPENLSDKPYKIIFNMIDKNINSPLCSSLGRLFDGVSSLIGFDKSISFEGEAAIYLENICDSEEKGFYNYSINENNKLKVIDIKDLIIGILKDLRENIKKEKISKKFHNTIIEIALEMAVIIRKEQNINTVVLSGGVFQNEILLIGIYNRLKENGFEVYRNKLIPINDSGVSLGQIVISKYREEN